MVFDRDETVLEWLEIFKIATSKQLNQIEYFNINVCNRRLKIMRENKLIYYAKNPYELGYVYSSEPIKNFKQYRHKMKRNEFYFALRDIATIDLIEVEPTRYGSVRPDAVFGCYYKDNYYLFFVEIEISNNTIDVEKYNNFLLEEYFKFYKIKPMIVYVTEKRVSTKAVYDYIKIDTTLTHMADLFKKRPL